MQEPIRTVTDLKTKLRAELSMRKKLTFGFAYTDAAAYADGYDAALESVLEQLDEVMAA